MSNSTDIKSEIKDLEYFEKTDEPYSFEDLCKYGVCVGFVRDIEQIYTFNLKTEEGIIRQDFLEIEGQYKIIQESEWNIDYFLVVFIF